MPLPRSHRSARLIQGYFWLSPLFFLASWRYGFDVRVPFLDEMPGARATYYALTTGCAALVTFRPAAAVLAARVESTVSVILLIVTTWMAYFNAIDSAASDAVVNNPFTPEAATSLVLSALVLAVSGLLQETGRLRAA